MPRSTATTLRSRKIIRFVACDLVRKAVGTASVQQTATPWHLRCDALRACARVSDRTADPKMEPSFTAARLLLADEQLAPRRAGRQCGAAGDHASTARRACGSPADRNSRARRSGREDCVVGRIEAFDLDVDGRIRRRARRFALTHKRAHRIARCAGEKKRMRVRVQPGPAANTARSLPSGASMQARSARDARARARADTHRPTPPPPRRRNREHRGAVVSTSMAHRSQPGSKAVFMRCASVAGSSVAMPSSNSSATE